jgi:hypothetical protein
MDYFKNIIKKVIFPIFIPLISFIFLVYCSDNSTPNQNNSLPEGNLINRSDCKSNSKQSDNEITSKNESCIQWEYKDNGILLLNHINSAFNCCPGNITANINFINDTIIIETIEEKAQCDCICLFDLNYQMKNLKSEIYYIMIKEQYGIPEDKKLEFRINVKDSPTGTYCVARDRYPWGI